MLRLSGQCLASTEGGGSRSVCVVDQRARRLPATRQEELDLAQPAARIHLRRELAIAEDVDLLAEAVVGDVEVDRAAPAQARGEV